MHHMQPYDNDDNGFEIKIVLQVTLNCIASIYFIFQFLSIIHSYIGISEGILFFFTFNFWYFSFQIPTGVSMTQ